MRILAMDSSDAATLYAAGGGGGYKTTDAGASWTLVCPFQVTGLAVEPGHAGTVYLGATNTGVLKSTNGGATWDAVTPGLVGVLIEALAVDPNDPSVVYDGGVALPAGRAGGVLRRQQ